MILKYRWKEATKSAQCRGRFDFFARARLKRNDWKTRRSGKDGRLQRRLRQFLTDLFYSIRRTGSSWPTANFANSSLTMRELLFLGKPSKKSWSNAWRAGKSTLPARRRRSGLPSGYTSTRTRRASSVRIASATDGFA